MLLRPVPDSLNHYVLGGDAVQNDVRSSANHQLTRAGHAARMPEIGMMSERFDHRNDASSQTFGSIGFISCHVDANLAQPGKCDW